MARSQKQQEKKTSEASKQNKGTKKNLQDVKKDFEKLEKQEEKTNKKIEKQREEVKRTKEKLIKNLLGLLERIGIDPSNREEIDSFLASLKAKNPDLMELFEIAFNGLLEADVASEEPLEENPSEEKEEEKVEEGDALPGEKKQATKEKVPEFPSLSDLQPGQRAEREGQADLPKTSPSNPAKRMSQSNEEAPMESLQKIISG